MYIGKRVTIWKALKKNSSQPGSVIETTKLR